jgi:hypothetical protein
MVVLVTVVVASVLGTFAYRSSKAQTESLGIHDGHDGDRHGHCRPTSSRWRPIATARCCSSIVGGIVLMGLVLGFTGIIVTHRLVGPRVQAAQAHPRGGGRQAQDHGASLRKGDELQEVFEAFAEMINALRSAQAKEIAELDAAIAHAREAGVAARAARGHQGRARSHAVRNRLSRRAEEARMTLARQEMARRAEQHVARHLVRQGLPHRGDERAGGAAWSSMWWRSARACWWSARSGPARANRFGTPGETISHVKIARVREATRAWLRKEGRTGQAVRLDAAALTFDGPGGAPRMEYYEGAL